MMYGPLRLLCHCEKPREGETLPWVEMVNKGITYYCPKCGNHIPIPFLTMYHPFFRDNEKLLSIDILPIKHRITVQLMGREKGEDP